MEVANLLLRITGDNTQAKSALNEVAAKLASLAATDAEARIRVDGGRAALAEIDQLNKSLDVIGQRKVSARVQVDIENYRGKLALLKRELELATRGAAGARPLAEIIENMAELSGEIGKVMGAGAQMSGMFSNLTGSAGSLAGAIGTTLVQSLGTAALMIGALMVAAVALLPVLAAVVVVIAALAASLLAAVAGFALIATSALVVAIPALAVLIGVIVKVVGAFKALKEEQEGAKEASEQLAAAQRAHSDALRAQGDAQLNASRQLVAARDAERDAALAALQAEDALRAARLGVETSDTRADRARLNLAAKRTDASVAGPEFARLLPQFLRFDELSKRKQRRLVDKIGDLPGDTDLQLDVRDAFSEVASANIGTSQAANAERAATNGLADAKERNNEFTRLGALAYEPYVAALKAVEASNRRVAETSAAITKIRREQTEETRKFSEEELSAARAVRELGSEIKEMFSRIAGPALEGLTSMIKGISDLLDDRGIQTALGEIGEAFGDVFRSFGRLLQTREVRDIMEDLARAAGRLVRIMGRGVFQDLFLILIRIARAAAPAMIDFFRAFARWLRNLRRSSEDADGLRDKIDSLVDTFWIWWDIAKQIARIIINFFKDSKEDSDSLSDSIRRVLRRFANFLDTDEGRRKVKEWLRDAIRMFRDIGSAIAWMVEKIQDFIEAIAWLLERARDINDLFQAADRTFSNSADERFDAAEEQKNEKQQSLLDRLHVVREELKDPDLTRRRRRKLENLEGRILHEMRTTRFHTGGLIPGVGDLDITALGGEFVFRKEAVDRIGVPALSRLNAGLPALAGVGGGGRAGGMNVENFQAYITSPPGTSIDERHTVARLEREIRMRGH